MDAEEAAPGVCGRSEAEVFMLCLSASLLLTTADVLEKALKIHTDTFFAL